MNNNIKKIIAALCAITLSASLTVFTEAAEIFTIEKAIEYAKEKSYKIETLENNILAAKNSAESARLTQKKLKNIANDSYMSYSGIDTTLVQRGYYYHLAQFSHRSAQRALISAEYELESNIELAFYDYINSKKKVDFAQEDLDKAKSRYEYASKKYAQGSISALELESFSLAQLNAQNALNSANRTQNSKLMNFKALINYPLDKELDLVGTFERQPIDTTTVTEATKLYESSVSKADLDENFALAKEKFASETAYYTAGKYEFFTAKANFANSEGQYNQALNGAKISIQTAYDNMQNIYETLDYLDKSFGFIKAQEQAAKIRYEQGTITSNDYLDAAAQLTSMQNTIADTELGAWNAVVSYRKLFDCKNTVFAQ